MSGVGSGSGGRQSMPEWFLRMCNAFRLRLSRVAPYMGRLLAVAWLSLFVATLVATCWLWPSSTTPSDGGSIISFQLSKDYGESATILNKWLDTDENLSALSDHVREDNRFVAIYVVTSTFVTLLACGTLAHVGRLKSARIWAFTALAAIASAGVVDRLAENYQLEKLISQAKSKHSPIVGDQGRERNFEDLQDVINALRRDTIIKFLLLIVCGASQLALMLAMCRQLMIRWIRRRQPGGPKQVASSESQSEQEKYQHLDLIEREIGCGERAGTSGKSVSKKDSKPVSAKSPIQCDHLSIQVCREGFQEPFVVKPGCDLVGLALSGGGIRSATFALGILTRLRSFGLLKEVDYLSTVSGGGYIGGWAKKTGFFRSNIPQGGAAEEPPIRHLRRFGNFLAPRWGLLRSETWTAMVAVLGGLLPALLVSTALIMLGQCVWLALVSLTSGPYIFGAGSEAVVAGALTVLTCVLIAKMVGLSIWKASNSGNGRGLLLVDYAVCAAILIVSAAMVGFTHSHLVRTVTQPAPNSDLWMAWMQLVGAESQPSNVTRELSVLKRYVPLFFLGFSWLAAAMGLCVARLLLMSCIGLPPNTANGQHWLRRSQWLDWSIGGMLVFGGGWVVVAAMWSVAILLRQWGENASYAAFVGSATSAGVVLWFRQQLPQLFRQEQSSGLKQAIKPYLPIVLSYASVVLFFVASAILLMTYVGNSPAVGLIVIGVAAGLLVGSLFLPSDKFGLHDFYRGRIARAFLGAPSFGGVQQPENGRGNIQTREQQGDDCLCWELSAERPYHLVCCAANDVAGDPLNNLNRGARSAVVTRDGLMIGGGRRQSPGLRYSSALTASAAAFNSQMGRASVAMGPAVAFLMCSLNTRLGLWQPHPEAAAQDQGLFPGWPRYLEMFNQTKAYQPADKSLTVTHLSDGGHFENLGLYELIRRRCRFIIVSDAGQDQNVKFEDFGNAVRRVREDFHADIDIDLTPLRPDERGFSKQHVAVGTIRYDVQGSDVDIGVLVYFKPAMTGDEPVDVLNYKSLNPAFPHESTADQFYDEAQWEAYRALGYHAAFQAFHFLDGKSSSTQGPASISKVFSDVRNAWYPTPADFDEKMVALNQRFVALERRLAAEAPLAFVQEIYPELAVVEPSALKAPDRASDRRCVHLIAEMIQLIEDTWLIAEFERYYNHPFMVGWINAFNRWTRAKTFRQWWPFLSPLYSSGMRQFAESRFHVPRPADPTTVATAALHLRFSDEAALDLPESLLKPSRSPTEAVTRRFYMECSLDSLNDWLTVGLFDVKIERSNNGKAQALSWTEDDFHMRPGMWNAGFGTAFLAKLIKEKQLGDANPLTNIAKLTVTMPGSGSGHVLRSAGNRRERNDLFLFYTSLGFKLRPSIGSATGPSAVILDRSM